MLKIGDFSKLSRVSIRMLRHYDELGLLKPVRIDPESGYRYYAPEQLTIAGRINALKDMGFGLAAIGELLPCYDNHDALQGYLMGKRAELQALSAQTAYRIRLLDSALTRLQKEDNTMKYDVTVKTFPPRYAATVRMVIPTYEQEGMLWNLLMQETAPLNLQDADPCYCCAVFHDKEYREADVEVEVSKDVRGHYADTEHVRFRELPELTVACATCKGSYEQMGDINAAIAAWVQDNGYAFDGPMFNIYHVSPHETSNPDEYVTEVCYPVCKA
ncbi:MAG: MerR family transcriptional regulator [Aristaeellaceae bacterium]